MPVKIPDADKALTRKFLRCYGPSTKAYFMDWLGCSPKQAKRLWDSIADEMIPVTVGNKTCWMLADNLETLLASGGNISEGDGQPLLLLGAHDPYLDIRDRSVILEQQSLHKTVWKTVANPGVILKCGRIAGIWKTKTTAGKLERSVQLFEPLSDYEKKVLKSLAEEYAAFRLLNLKGVRINT